MSKYRTIEVMVTDDEYAALCEEARRNNEHNKGNGFADVEITPESVAGGAINNWLSQVNKARRQQAEGDDSDELYRDYQQLRRNWGEYLDWKSGERGA